MFLALSLVQGKCFRCVLIIDSSSGLGYKQFHIIALCGRADASKLRPMEVLRPGLDTTLLRIILWRYLYVSQLSAERQLDENVRASSPQILGSRAAVGPTQPDERIVVLDILRGFALLGMLMVNVPFFSTPSLAWSLGEPWFPGPVNRIAEWLINFLGSGKFNAIFSFLFGVGLTFQLERAAERNTPFVATYLRRLAALLVFGIAHCLLLWTGDVLHVYATLGLLLLLFRRIPDRVLFAVIVILLVAPAVRSSYQLYRSGPSAPPHHPPTYWSTQVREQLRLYEQGTYAEMVRDRARDMREIYSGAGRASGLYASMLVTMLLGFYAGRHRIFQNLPEHLPFIHRLMLWTLGLGLISGLAFATSAVFVDSTKPTLLGVLSNIFYRFNRPLLCLFYLSAIVLLCQRAGWQARLAPLASVGRMPLTNYIMQSVICTTIFYNYGLGLFGKVGPALGLLLAVAIYAVQVIYSTWWLARFRFGPMEWLLRVVTYGRASATRLRRELTLPVY